MRHAFRAPLLAAFVGALGLCGRSMSSAGASEPTPEPVILIMGESVCGDGFSSAFFGDKQRVRPASAGEVAREFEVTFVREPNGGIRGQLLVRDGARDARREVRGRGCNDAMRSLLLVARLALDEGRSALPASSDAGVTDASPDPAVPSVSDASRLEPTDAAALAAADADGSAASSAPILSYAAHGDLVLGMRAAALVAPSFVIAPGLGFEWHGDPGAIPLVLGAGFSLGLPTEVARASGAARLIWFSPEVRLCVGAIHGGERLRLEPCARVDVGALSATGLRVGQAQSEVRAWMTTSLSARLRWRFAKNLSFGAEAGLTAPLIREEFVVAKASANEPAVLYKPPFVAFFSGLSLQLTIF